MSPFFTQFAAIGLIVATVLTVFGRTWARQLAFPLGFLFFAVPFGEGLLPILMEWTADVTVGALRVTGIPVYRGQLLRSSKWRLVGGRSVLRRALFDRGIHGRLYLCVASISRR